MKLPSNSLLFRVRYGETDQMGTFSSSAALDWFEWGRTELLRSLGVPYAEMEQRGVFLPVVEAHVFYRARARYDDLLQMTTTARMEGRARVRCDVQIVHASSGRDVVEGHTVHAFTGPDGRPIRPPEWFVEALAKAQSV